MRVLVTGSRSWTDETAVIVTIGEAIGHVPDDQLHTVTVVHGACPSGADAYAGYWARQLGLTVESHPADWSRGKGAGFERNEYMVSLGADVCLAFIKDHSPGASHCAAKAEEAGIKTIRIEK